MVTLKQLEALRWIAELGTFERAAAKLHTTQSAVSKRIRELEAEVGVAVFDREQRSARLTEKGEHVLALGQEMLALKDRISGIRDARDLPPRILRLGVTEICSLTWLPLLVKRLRETFPGLVIAPEVATGRDLFGRLLDDALDLIVAPDAFSDPAIRSVWLADVPGVWAASPALIAGDGVTPLEELASFTVLMQGVRSGSGTYLGKWLRAQGVSFPNVIAADNLVALVGLAVAGLGVTYLPGGCFDPLILAGRLKAIETDPPLPPLPYAAMHRTDHPSNFPTTVAELARDCCDFSRSFTF